MVSPPEKQSASVLRITAGPAGGREIELGGPSFTLGRGVEADIAIADERLSREHLRLYREGLWWFIEDLNSTNGTWVDNIRVDRPQVLRAGSTVRAGETRFELRMQGADRPGRELDEALIAYRVHPASVENLTITEVKAASARVKQEQDKLASIYNVQRLLNTVRDPGDLYVQILKCIWEVVPADHLYLLVREHDSDAIVPMAGLDAQGNVEDLRNLAISHSILTYVKDNEQGILSVDAPADDRFLGESIYATKAHSVMCVPMLGQQEFCGMIYAMSTHDVRAYTEDELRLLTAIARSAGLAIENNRLLAENLRKERMATIGLAAASLSHHVKNVIAGLDSSISLLRMGIDSADRQLMDQAWGILSRNHGRLSGLMLDLLNLAREDRLEIGPCNVSEVVLETVELVRPQAEEAKISLRASDRLSGKPARGEVDAGGIHRVVLNLLNNAIQAVEERHGNEGSGEIFVDGWSDEERGEVVIEVRDNGVGIPAEDTDRIFEFFHTGRGARGTGLGLSVSKRLVGLHGGEITVSSAIGGGATFRVVLPVRHDSGGS